MSKLKACKYCGHSPEQDRLIMDEVWTSYYIGCSNPLCDSMISIESPRSNREYRLFVEHQLQLFWNAVNA